MQISPQELTVLERRLAERERLEEKKREVRFEQYDPIGISIGTNNLEVHKSPSYISRRFCHVNSLPIAIITP